MENSGVTVYANPVSLVCLLNSAVGSERSGKVFLFPLWLSRFMIPTEQAYEFYSEVSIIEFSGRCV